jgi:tRNA(Ile)-lysidine synthase
VPGQPVKVAVAYSGGLDSTALLHLAHACADRYDMQLHAFHIHHGISPNADAWLSHCRASADDLCIRFDARQVGLQNISKSGIEEAARLARYAALGELCRAHGVTLLLTAHHLDDQAETILLQLFRGSGVAGLSGMNRLNAAPGLVGDAGLRIARPLLDVTRHELAAWIRMHGITCIDDETNTDTRYARNALRLEVMPVIERYFPGFQRRLRRTAGHARAAQKLLDDVAANDLALCQEGECILLARLRQLSTDRIDNVLRHWFIERRVRMPGTAWLHEMRKQILDARPDAQVHVTHPDCHVRRHRDRIYLIPRMDDGKEIVLSLDFTWAGESRLDFPAFQGALLFENGEEGIDAAWLRGRGLTIRYRSGGERLKPASNRATRSLKHHYQALNIPVWARQRLPVVLSGTQLLYAAGIGMDCHCFAEAEGLRIRLRWIPDGETDSASSAGGSPIEICS